MNVSETPTLCEIVSLAPTADALYLLFVEYEEGEGGNAPGTIYRTDGARETVLEAVLSTNDIVRCLWASPSGALWASSEDGNVYTTAKVKWPKPTDDDVAFNSAVDGLTWTVTTLPDLREEGYAPTLDVLWGTGDDNVFVAAHGGHIYRWDGTSWKQVHTAPGNVRDFDGPAADDVHAVGEEGTLLHFDGAAWRALKAPDGAEPDEDFTGCCTGPDGSLVVCSNSGRVLHGGRSGFAVLAHDDDLQFMSVTMLGNRVILAAKDAGVIELGANGFSVARDTFHAVSVTPMKGKALFLDASSEPTYVEYDPANKKLPWARIDF